MPETQMHTLAIPTRDARSQEIQALAEAAAEASLTGSPAYLHLDSIRENSAVFQPRFDSIAYAPGRSERHIAELARIAKAGTDLDPVTIAAFGDSWYLLDGHHRLEAYRQAGRTEPVPVQALQSELTGAGRVHWAIQESVRDNKKNRLSMSPTDKMDAAWAAVARGDDVSIAKTAALYGIGPRAVSNMRSARKTLVAAEVDPTQHPVLSWSAARRETERLEKGGRETPDWDQDAREAQLKRKAAKSLRPVMDMELPPRLLAEVLEEYAPGLVEAMGRFVGHADDGWDDLI
ncbi:ParB/RepB/Spo0J family partition protein [Croceicoccus bisphenolivorans]|uniref:ParB/RepB/Spo0J family partition protein n=1 Tax=Croceicoccus bisphenolivorans TaxID=1783232 RepID=UPI00155F678F|nr:ParB/RepB/Spo0J family partition protein [Croceicoccus bisphenolivorans]